MKMKVDLLSNKRILVLLFVFFLRVDTAIASYDFFAVCSTGQTLYYKITDYSQHYVQITYPGTSTSNPWSGYNKPIGTLLPPNSVSCEGIDYTVTSISQYAFYGCSGLTEVTIPEGVTIIDNYAFWACPGIESVHFNATNCTQMYTYVAVTGQIQDKYRSVFNSGSASDGKPVIATLTIGDNVTCIPDYAFNDAIQLHGSLNIPASVQTIGNYAFYNCVSLNFLNLQEGLVSIGDYAFYNNTALEGRHHPLPRGLYLPNSLTTVGDYAFKKCSVLPLLSIGEGATSIGNQAFWECPILQTVIFNAINCTTMHSKLNDTYEYSVFDDDYTPIVNLTIGELVTRIPDCAFRGSNRIQGELSLPNTLITIGDNAFRSCYGYTGSLTIPNNVVSIGNYAFAYCGGFTESLTIPNAVTTIGHHAFFCCSGLTELTIGEEVNTVGYCAFYGCPALTIVHFNATNCTQMITETYSSSSYTYYWYSVFSSTINTSGANPIVTLTIGDNVTNIPSFAFYNCTNLISDIVIPDATTSIGGFAFYGAHSAELTIGTGVNGIGQYAFWNCPLMTTVHFNATCCETMYSKGWSGSSSNPTYTYYSVFNTGTVYNYYVSGLGTFYPTSIGTAAIESLTIGDNVTRIPDYAFRYSSNMTSSVTIPDACTYLGSYSFANSSGHDISIGTNVTIIKDHAFDSSPGFNGTVTIGSSVIKIDECAFNGCSGLQGNLVLPDPLITIGNQAFKNCSGLVGNLGIPDGVKTIGSSAFYGCSGFTGDLVIPHSVTSLGSNAFCNCGGFDGSLVLGSGLTAINDYVFYNCYGFNGALILGRNINGIGNYSFYNCSGFSCLIATHTPSITAQDHSFGYGSNTMNYGIPVYIPYGTINNFRNATGWNHFTNFQNQCLFENYEGQNWSEIYNWAAMELPLATDVVCINGTCQMDISAQVRYVYVMDVNKSLTINDGATISSTFGIGNVNPTQLVIEDGGAFFNPLPNAFGTVKKQIDAFSDAEDGWYTVASPIYGGTSTILLTTGAYDLYAYDEPTATWLNEKVEGSFDKLNLAEGYLYASQLPKTLDFTGQLNASNAELAIPVSCANGNLAGFNLVGNPYTNNINITDVKINGISQTVFYRAEGGNSLVAYVAEDSVSIKVGEGFFVRATENGTLTFGDARARSENNQQGSYVRLVLSQNDQIADRAYLSLNEGMTLEKISANTNDIQIFFENDGKSYAVADNEANNSIMTIFLENGNGTYTIEATLLNAECGYLHLIDSLTGIDIDLLETPTYTFEAKPTDYACRFKLVLSVESIHRDADGNNATFTY